MRTCDTLEHFSGAIKSAGPAAAGLPVGGPSLRRGGVPAAKSDEPRGGRPHTPRKPRPSHAGAYPRRSPPQLGPVHMGQAAAAATPAAAVGGSSARGGADAVARGASASVRGVQSAAAAIFEAVDVALDPCIPLLGVFQSVAQMPARFGITATFGGQSTTVLGGDLQAPDQLRRVFQALDEEDMSEAAIELTFFKLPWAPS